MSLPSSNVFQSTRGSGNRTHERGEIVATGSGSYANNAIIGIPVRFDFAEPLINDPTPGAQYALYVWNPSTVTALNVRLLNRVDFAVTGRHDIGLNLFTAPAVTGTPQILGFLTNSSMWMVSGGFSIYVTNATALGAADAFTFEWQLVRI